MSTAVRLVPEPVRPQTPQCCVEVPPPSHDPTWRDRRYYSGDPKKCRHHSVVLIDGNPYCARHGGQVALRKLLGEI